MNIIFEGREIPKWEAMAIMEKRLKEAALKAVELVKASNDDRFKTCDFCKQRHIPK